MDILGGIFWNILEGYVDRVIYRDFIVNRRFFIYCSLATAYKYGSDTAFGDESGLAYW